MKNQIKNVFRGNQIFTKFYLYISRNLVLFRPCMSRVWWWRPENRGGRAPGRRRRRVYCTALYCTVDIHSVLHSVQKCLILCLLIQPRPGQRRNERRHDSFYRRTQRQPSPAAKTLVWRRGSAISPSMLTIVLIDNERGGRGGRGRMDDGGWQPNLM